MSKYEQIKNMTLDEMAVELEKIALWDKKQVRRAKRHFGRLKNAIKIILLQPVESEA